VYPCRDALARTQDGHVPIRRSKVTLETQVEVVQRLWCGSTVEGFDVGDEAAAFCGADAPGPRLRAT
jgi:hypothetical protein